MRNKQVHGEQARLFGTIQIMWIKQDYVKHAEHVEQAKLSGTGKSVLNKLALLFI